jgi:hypothetical protein
MPGIAYFPLSLTASQMTPGYSHGGACPLSRCYMYNLCIIPARVAEPDERRQYESER